ncbi:MAG TPA: protein phosphatase 2C domain-containing protein [Trichocoleus sp.]
MNRPERLPSRYKPFLWVLGEGLETLPVGELVDRRYQVIAPRIWLDTQPEQRPPCPDSFPPRVIPYLKGHPHRLHLPGVHGILEGSGIAPVVLLENAPLHPQSGELYPDLATAWTEAAALRQMNWLWQLWDLWPTLAQLGVASSVLTLENVRVEGWRIRLLELIEDRDQPPTIQALATAWRPLLKQAQDSLVEPLSHIVDALQSAASETEIDPIATRLNHLLLTQAAQVPVRVALAGATSQGPTQPRNEDACYPLGLADNDGSPAIAILCDGVGGHEGGKIASQLTVQSLHLQLRALLSEAQDEDNILPPSVIKQQIEAVIRIVNDVINNQNDNQGRADRQRMGTTLALAVFVPQRVQTAQGWERVDELYIAHIGDSRAYWITPDYCHLLTVDHDIASREVTACRQILSVARERPDATALTQAIGTRGVNYLHPYIQRFIIDETGVLLLCSDGLSDHDRVEEAWANYIGLIVKEIVSLESAVASWIELANQKNGHDNTTVVMAHCKAISKATPPLSIDLASRLEDPTEMTEASRALLYGETTAESSELQPDPLKKRGLRGVPIWAWIVGAFFLVAGMVSLGLILRPPSDRTPPPPTENNL